LYYKFIKIKILCQALFLGLFLLNPLLTLAATGDVIINEIAWMGTETSSSDEWIELYNTTSQDIDLTDWTLASTDGTPDITLSGTIAANSYFLLERTDDNSVPSITADQIYTGALGNSGENLELKDNSSNLIDSADHSGGWTAGDNSTKQTMELVSSAWQTSTDIGGTPKAQNSISTSTTTEDTSTTTESTTTTSSDSTDYPPFAIAGTNITALTNQEIPFDASESYDRRNDPLTYFWNFGDGATDTEKKTTHTYAHPGQYLVTLMVSDGAFESLDIITVNIYDQSVIISEFSKDWIELYNQSDSVANLTDWQLVNSSSSLFIFPPNSLIGPKQFLVLRKEITKMEFNDNQISLIYPDGSIGIEINYSTQGKENFCIAFNGSDYFWTNMATPGTSNIISTQPIIPKSFSVNNPKIPKQETNNLTQEQNFNTQNQATTTNTIQPTKEIPKNELKDTQSASIFQSQQNTKSNLITYIILITSASLVISWIVIKIRKRVLKH